MIHTNVTNIHSDLFLSPSAEGTNDVGREIGPLVALRSMCRYVDTVGSCLSCTSREESSQRKVRPSQSRPKGHSRNFC